MNRIILSLLLSLTVLSCSKNGLFDAGPTTTRVIDLSDTFNLIEVGSIFNITLVQDSVDKVLVTCGQNLQKDVDIHITNKVLYLLQHTRYNWSRSYQKVGLELHVRQLPPMNIRQPIGLTSEGTLTMPEFIITDWGRFSDVDVDLNVTKCLVAMSSDNFGYYKISGKCSSAYLWGWGSCTVRADSLVADRCQVLQRGWGNVYVNFTTQLEVSIENSGNIYYLGNPDHILIDTQTGGGKIIPLDGTN